MKKRNLNDITFQGGAPKDFLRKSWYLCLFALLFCTNAMMAQNRTVTGTVLDENNVPLPGVSVVLQGSQSGAISDFDGNFEISVPQTGASLKFTYIGYTPQTVAVQGQDNISVTMQPDVTALDEVVVVGYGTQLKRDVTGATSSVTPEEIAKRPIVRVEQALQGTTPGVSVVSNSGQPGKGLSVKIRGANSITGSSDPLYVIDGSIGADITSVSPNDIASMEILKDASATAIYGSRGSNGVVLITTKGGTTGKMHVDLDTWVSQASIPKHLDLMNAYDFATVVNATNVSTGGLPAFSDAQLQELQAQGGTDWHDELERSPYITNHQLAISGGTDNFRYRTSYNHLDQPGLIINQYYKKDVFRTNLDIDANDKLNIKINLSAVMSKGRNNNYQGDLTDPFSQANIWDPTSPVFNSEGKYVKNSVYGSNGFNPVATQNNHLDDTSNRNFYGTGILTYKFNDFLTFTSNSTYKLGSNYNQLFDGPDTDRGTVQGPYARVNSGKYWAFQTSNFVTLNKTFGDHNFTLTALYELQKYEGQNINAEAINLTSPNLGYYNLGLGGTKQLGSGYSADALQSYMGRLNYSFKNRYLLTLSYRIDGSSHLTDKYSEFPSVAVGWNLGEENFLKDSNVISDLKLRASYGETGNQAVGAYSTIPRVQTGNPYFFDGATPTVTTPLGAPVSPSLEWENTKQKDIGMDISFLNRRLSLTADYYNKDITKLLYNYQAPFYMGGETYQTNLGSLTNEGFEFAVTGFPISKEKFKWRTNLSLSFNKNKVEDLQGLDNVEVGNIGSAQSGVTFLKVGHPLAEFYGYEFLGTWKTSEAAEAAEYGMKPGDAKFADLNGDKIYDPEDRKIIGNGMPDYTFGFINDFDMGNFTFSFMFQGMVGNEIYSQTLAYIWGGQGQAKTPTTREALNMWTPQNETDNPAFSNTSKNFLNSSRYVYDGSFAKLKNISLAYNFPTDFLDKYGLRNLQVYVSAQNVFTITDYPGYDPEINNAQSALTQGLEMGVIPNPRTYTLGLRVGL